MLLYKGKHMHQHIDFILVPGQVLEILDKCYEVLMVLHGAVECIVISSHSEAVAADEDEEIEGDTVLLPYGAVQDYLESGVWYP
jgi:hypothetical protein